MPTIAPALARQINATRRSLRRQKRCGDSHIGRARCWVALKGLTELEARPMRPGLAVAVAMAVRRAVA